MIIVQMQMNRLLNSNNSKFSVFPQMESEKDNVYVNLTDLMKIEVIFDRSSAQKQ